MYPKSQDVISPLFFLMEIRLMQGNNAYLFFEMNTILRVGFECLDRWGPYALWHDPHSGNSVQLVLRLRGVHHNHITPRKSSLYLCYVVPTTLVSNINHQDIGWVFWFSDSCLWILRVNCGSRYSATGEYVQMMQLGRFKYLRDHILYHAYSVCSAVLGLAYETLPILL